MPDLEGDREDDGYNACMAGRPLSANPYGDSTIVGYQAWRRGWLKAEAYIDAKNETVQFREPKAPVTVEETP